MAKGKYHDWLTPEGLLRLEGWARDGLTDEQIAGNMGVKRQTLYDWKNKHPDISDALKKGKEVVDRAVENALLKRALGYRYDEITREAVKQTNEETGEQIVVMAETKRVTKEVQGDTTAQIFWLKNRRPDKWRDKQDVEHSGSIETTNPFAGLTTDELRKLIDSG
ncbi:hypothetical protein D3C75_427320 [compost metagenome]